MLGKGLKESRFSVFTESLKGLPYHPEAMTRWHPNWWRTLMNCFVLLRYSTYLGCCSLKWLYLPCTPFPRFTPRLISRWNPKPQTPNPKPQTPNPKPQTPNPKPQTPTPCCRLWAFKACTASKSFSSSACAIPPIGFKYFITPNYFIMFLRFYTLVRYLREREAVQVNRTSTPKIQTTFQFRLTFCHRCGPSEPSSTATAW